MRKDAGYSTRWENSYSGFVIKDFRELLQAVVCPGWCWQKVRDMRKDGIHIGHIEAFKMVFAWKRMEPDVEFKLYIEYSHDGSVKTTIYQKCGLPVYEGHSIKEGKEALSYLYGNDNADISDELKSYFETILQW